MPGTKDLRPTVGVSGETMLINRLALSADIAYLPYVNFSGVDDHFFSNTGQIACVYACVAGVCVATGSSPAAAGTARRE